MTLRKTALNGTAPAGVVAIYVHEDRVIASVADFDQQTFSGFDLERSQEIRVSDALSRAVLNAYCSPLVPNSLDTRTCEQIVAKMPGKAHFLPIGHVDRRD
jgi:hypothetical protein